MENLGIDIKLLVAQIINFVLFFIIFKKFVAKPFVGFLNEEKNKEKQRDELLGKLKKDEEELSLKEKQIRNNIKKETDLILEQVKKDASVVKKDILDQAKKEAEDIKSRADKQLLEDRNKLYTEVKDKITELSFIIVEKALKDNLDEESKRKITDDIIKNSKLVNIN